VRQRDEVASPPPESRPGAGQGGGGAARGRSGRRL